MSKFTNLFIIFNFNQGYLSIVVDVFIDFNVNLKTMTVRMTIQYLSFFCFICNGTTVLAEIHREVMSDPDYYRAALERCNSDVWVFLKFCAKKLNPDSMIGSCTERRYRYHPTKENFTEWNLYTEDLFELCQTFAGVHHGGEKMNELKLRKLCSDFLHEIKSRNVPGTKKAYYSGAGPLGTLQFLQLAGILGLIPLYCATYAELDSKASLGPKNFINKCIKINEENSNINSLPEEATWSGKGKRLDKTKIGNRKQGPLVSEEFFSLHKSLTGIWGDLITLALLENLLCECSRSFKRTCKNHKLNESTANVSVIEDPQKMLDSSVKDIIYYNERRKCVQNFYTVKVSGSGASKLKPLLCMKISQQSENENKTMYLTSWSGGCNGTSMMNWSDDGSNRTLDSTFEVKKNLRELFALKG